MSDPPRYPPSDDDAQTGLGDEPTRSRPNRSMLLVFAILALLLAVMVVLHLAGVAPTH